MAVVALNDVTIAFPAGKFTAVMGPVRINGITVSDTPSTLPAETAHMNAVGHSASRLVGVTKVDDSGADQVIVLGSVDVEFTTGAVAALLMGPPGSGKSALMHFLTGSTS